MDNKSKILDVAQHLLSLNGLNAFSYKDISHKVGIKTSSIHYYFPSKSDLIFALINEASMNRKEVMLQWKVNSSIEQLDAFMDFYIQLAKERKMCLIMSISSDMYELDDKIRDELHKFYNFLKDWLISILEDGLRTGHLYYETSAEKKATEILNTVAMIPILSRIGKDLPLLVDIKDSFLQSLNEKNC